MTSAHTLPLERLALEAMASGHRSLRLTDQVTWEEFPEYAKSVIVALGGTILSRADAAVQRVWDVTIQGEAFWIAFDDFGLGVSLDPKDEAADNLIPSIRETLLPLAPSALAVGSVYSAGDCSVCASAGAAIFVSRLTIVDVFFACSSCGCAWVRPPVAHQVDQIDSVETFAPEGFCIATFDEIMFAGLTKLIRHIDTELCLGSFVGMAGFRSRDEVTLNDIVRRVLVLPRWHRSSDHSLTALVRATGYSRDPVALTLSALTDGLRLERSLIQDWLSYSEDKRTSSGWFLSRTLEGLWLVGYYPTGPRHLFADVVDACATFIAKEVSSVAHNAG